VKLHYVENNDSLPFTCHGTHLLCNL